MLVRSSLEMNKNEGFSLIELLIVVAIIGIIAAMAAPNIIASRKAANEASCISSMRTIHGAQATYQSTTGAGNFADSLTTLSNISLIDSALGGSTKSNYTYTIDAEIATGANPSTFYVSARPTSTSGITQTGSRKFGVTEDGIIRFSTDNLNDQFASHGAVTASIVLDSASSGS
jgi:type IV pilus assembly protein PilA